MRKTVCIFLPLLAFVGFSPAFAGDPLHHSIRLRLLPEQNRIEVTDRVLLPADLKTPFRFSLARGLTLESVPDVGVQLESARLTRSYTVTGIQRELELRYGGTPGKKIGEQGTLLTADEAWYPIVTGRLATFDLAVEAPARWTVVTQGDDVSHADISATGRRTSWRQARPQQSIDVVAGSFFTFDTPLADGRHKARVLLRAADANLAKSYLNLIPGFIAHFAEEIAPYPYTDFSVIENTEETGYGFPGFTLLGPTVVRLPFLLTSSLPHEILHNWWGNSVYVDYASGNWCEGLTTYLADHWQQEVAHTDAEYRQSTLIAYEDDVRAGADFPLRQFRERMDRGTQAVGYGKSMMFFHMLKVRFGDELFDRALRRFYQANQFRAASYHDIQVAFEQEAGISLAADFQQWIDRTGAPTIGFDSVKTEKSLTGGFTTAVTVRQTTKPLYDLRIPIELRGEDGSTSRTILHTRSDHATARLYSQVRPVRVAIDPNFDVFRHLDSLERPATVSGVLGAAKINYVLARDSRDERDFAETWRQSTKTPADVKALDGAITLPAEGALVLVGDDPKIAAFVSEQLRGYPFAADGTKLTLRDQSYSVDTHSWLVIARAAANPEQMIAWVRFAPGMNAGALARRLTHYGKFSALVFEKDPNVLKMTWPVVNSPLVRELDPKAK